MTDLLLVLLINFFALYTTSQYLAVLKKEEQKKTWRCLLPHFLLWCVLNTCCLILIRTKGVLSLFSAAVAAIILLFETIFAFQKEEAWKEKTRRREYMTSRQLQYYAKQYEALSHFQETMRKERHERKNLFIEIKNRYDGTIFKAQDGRLISRKENPQEHGMGLRIMHELLEHADGNVETMWDEHVFTLRVMIYHVI